MSDGDTTEKRKRGRPPIQRTDEERRMLYRARRQRYQATQNRKRREQYLTDASYREQAKAAFRKYYRKIHRNFTPLGIGSRAGSAHRFALRVKVGGEGMLALDIRALAEFLGVRIQTAKRWLKEGKLPAARITADHGAKVWKVAQADGFAHILRERLKGRGVYRLPSDAAIAEALEKEMEKEGD